jgi:hypothetical protein
MHFFHLKIHVIIPHNTILTTPTLKNRDFMKLCPYCRKKIENLATKCPYCTKDISDTPNDLDIPINRFTQMWKEFIVSLAALILAWFIGSFFLTGEKLMLFGFFICISVWITLAIRNHIRINKKNK